MTIDLSALGVSATELLGVGPQLSMPSSGDDGMLIVDDDGLDCPNRQYITIQAAVNAAMPGDKIKVCPGTYIEQVTIPTGKDGLTLFAEAAFQAVIKAPPAMTRDGSLTGQVRDTIKGPYPGIAYWDPNRVRIAITEAIKLGVPVVAMVDTNCDPDEVDYVIPSNDDAIRAVRVISSKIADAAIEGQQRRESQRADIDFTLEPGGVHSFAPDDEEL